MARKKYNKIVIEEVRNKMAGVKLTEKELEDVKKTCDELGVTVSRFFRYLYAEYKKNVR